MIESPQQTEQKSDGTTVVFVSLYLVLLAFFVMLSAISTTEEQKVRRTLDSVKATFRGPFYDDSGLIDIATRQGVTRTSNDALDDIGVLLAGLALGGPAKRQSAGDRLAVDFLTHDLFPPRRDAPRGETLALISELGEILASLDEESRIDVTFLIGRALERDGGQPEAIALQTRRAARFIDALTATGAKPGAFSAGLTPGDPARARLVFQAHLAEPAPAALDPRR